MNTHTHMYICVCVCIYIYIYIYIYICPVGDSRGAYRVLVGHLKESDYLQDLGVEWIFKKWGGEAWTGLVWLRIGAGGGRL